MRYAIACEHDQDGNIRPLIGVVHYDDNLQTFSDWHVSNNETDVLPDLGIMPGGQYIVGWYAGDERQIRFRSMTGPLSNGLETSGLLSINPGPVIDDGYLTTRRGPAIGVGADGNFGIAWTDDIDGNGWTNVWARGYTFSGVNIFDKRVNEQVNGNQ